MTLRPKPLPPDTRPDWRDPDMPVLVTVAGKLVAWSPDRAQRGYTWRMQELNAPTFRNDPTYHLRAKRVKGND